MRFPRYPWAHRSLSLRVAERGEAEAEGAGGLDQAEMVPVTAALARRYGTTRKLTAWASSLLNSSKA